MSGAVHEYKKVASYIESTHFLPLYERLFCYESVVCCGTSRFRMLYGWFASFVKISLCGCSFSGVFVESCVRKFFSYTLYKHPVTHA